MSLSLDGSSDVSAQSCDACGTTYLLVKSFVHDAGAAQAIVMTACHRHDGEREAWIDAVMGGLGEESTDRVTFGCRVGPVANKPEPAATAVAAAVPYDDAPLWGRSSPARRRWPTPGSATSGASSSRARAGAGRQGARLRPPALRRV